MSLLMISITKNMRKAKTTAAWYLSSLTTNRNTAISLATHTTPMKYPTKKHQDGLECT